MSIADEAPAPLRLIPLTADLLTPLAAGRPDWAAGHPILAGAQWPSDDRRVLRYRSEALAADPAAAPYLLHVIVDASGDVSPGPAILGRIGCHGAPIDGEVEIGYFVVPAARGRGIATWAVDTFLDWLRCQGVSAVVASVRPDNAASLSILRRRRFAQIGTRIDDEDGPELVLLADLAS